MSSKQTASSEKNSYLIPILIIGALFFVFGFVTWVNGTLIPYLQLALQLTTAQAVWVTFAFYISYAVMAFPSSWVLKRTGLKRGMLLGLLVMAVGTIIFIPAAQTRTYAVFLTGLFIIGTGLALLQTAANPYVTILGPIESAAKRMSIMGICNKGAGALAPFIMGTIMLKNVDGFNDRLAEMNAVQRAAELDALASRVVWPYIIMAIILVGLAVAIHYSNLPEIRKEEQIDEKQETNAKDRPYWWNYPYLLLGFLALFLYVGAEVMAGDIIQIYGDSIGIELSIARHFTSYTMIAMLIGYLLSIALIPRYLKQENALKISAVLAMAFSIGAIFTDGYTSIVFIALLGFANAVMWPAIWPLAID
ncbi:MAG TPA: glucose/galactose MFS transporter, partial [Flavobacteriaceae bacterium]|nr:glucose/galactose MFS transporter [Flavobacteriaceae bacterium]